MKSVYHPSDVLKTTKDHVWLLVGLFCLSYLSFGWSMYHNESMLIQPFMMFFIGLLVMAETIRIYHLSKKIHSTNVVLIRWMKKQLYVMGVVNLSLLCVSIFTQFVA